MPRVLQIQINSNILIRRMGARIGIAHSGSGDRQSQFVDEGMVRPDPPTSGTRVIGFS